MTTDKVIGVELQRFSAAVQQRFGDDAVRAMLRSRDGIVEAASVPRQHQAALAAVNRTVYWLRVSLTPRIRARGAEMADFFGYRLNGPKDVLSQHRHGGL
jgi:hypothetical protein